MSTSIVIRTAVAAATVAITVVALTAPIASAVICTGGGTCS
jgi:hypothetical protein